ncbi:hypothetical protein M3P21_01195 [Ruegeria sp. 2012CJ41-6]|uniref:Uncharacterized protein n=1 Tax=Ruegeria spongiae TaxID=2942209 RepID=A0ABT0PXN2_9RHOB|nr:hypothetical protein [Ruegeria spongiae]MCL6282132.1 hypothetical protein [Ruegeria spongiae]
MFFLKGAKFIAYLTVTLGVIRTFMGFVVAIVFVGHPDAVSRYLGSVESSGNTIDQGIILIFLGGTFGLVTHVAGAVFSAQSSDSTGIET